MIVFFFSRLSLNFRFLFHHSLPHFSVDLFSRFLYVILSLFSNVIFPFFFFSLHSFTLIFHFLYCLSHLPHFFLSVFIYFSYFFAKSFMIQTVIVSYLETGKNSARASSQWGFPYSKWVLYVIHIMYCGTFFVVLNKVSSA